MRKGSSGRLEGQTQTAPISYNLNKPNLFWVWHSSAPACLIFYPLQYQFRKCGIVGCIPEVHAFLLTPVLSHTWLLNTICHTWHICYIRQKWHNDIDHMTLCKYGVMGDKRTVRTSGMQCAIPNHLFSKGIWRELYIEYSYQIWLTCCI